jgi:hypothetical protein
VTQQIRETATTLAATDRWFLRHGLTYFVPEERAAVRKALRPRRTVGTGAAVVVCGAAAGVVLAWASGDVGAAPALLLTLAALAALVYGVTALRAGRIVAWALRRTASSARRLLPMVMRALPLLLLFVTFLFISADVWQMAANMPTSAVWLVGLLFVATSVLFLMVRLPEEVDRVDDNVDDDFLLRACRGTPLEEPCADLVADPDADPASYATIIGYERWNLVLSLLVISLAQVVLMSVGVFLFLLIFGSLAMSDGVQLAWTQHHALQTVPGLPNVSAELVRVSVFLSSFSLVYLTVSTVTDETFRAQFFGEVTHELERAVGMRAVYLALRRRTSG